MMSAEEIWEKIRHSPDQLAVWERLWAMQRLCKPLLYGHLMVFGFMLGVWVTDVGSYLWYGALLLWVVLLTGHKYVKEQRHAADEHLKLWVRSQTL